MSSSPPEIAPGLPAWACVSARRRAHIDRVVALLAGWADAIGVPAAERERWLRAGYYHDALKGAPRDELRRLAGGAAVPDALLHGPAAACAAEAHGERDVGVLDAARYHSIGYAGWDAAGRMLYLADYLEPGRRAAAATRAVRAARVPGDPDGVLREVAAERLAHAVRSGHPLLPDSVAFWNALA